MGTLIERILRFFKRLRNRLSTHHILFVLVCLGSLVLAYYAYQSYLGARKWKHKAQRFQDLLVEYKKLSPNDSPGEKPGTTSNPLAYLENVIQENGISKDRIGELTPSGTDRKERSTYRLNLQSTSLERELSLLRDIEKKRRLRVQRVNVERTGMESSRFDVQFQLLDPYSSEQNVVLVEP